MMYQYRFLDELIVDSFAGGGGASTGIELALLRIVDIAINHDIKAIQMHEQNHPYTKHYCENVFDVDPLEATQCRPVGLFWLSPDCTHFSKAKGGKPVKKEIRGLAWIAIKWAKAVKPRVIMLENVEEFKTWGPIDDTGHPIKERKGETFNEFVSALKELGYKIEWRELRACDYGAPTIRKRFFLIARCDELPIVWPEPTHGNGKLPYRTAAEIIDWSIPCPSIFDRKKPLSENTMKRIARGLKKFVFDNPQPFIVQIGQNEFAGDNRCYSIDKPLGTITSTNKFGLCAAYLAKHFGGNYSGAGSDLKDPLHTVTAQDHNSLCTAFISQRYGGENGKEIRPRGADVNAPLPTITATDHNQVVKASFIERQFGTSTGHKVDEPLATITSNDKSRLVQAFLIKYFGQGIGQDLNEPLHTITAKDRFGLITIEGKVKIEYQIVDIGMRMLEPHELFAAQGFPPDYKIAFDVNGKPYSKSEQVARCGNSVCPQVVTALVRANLAEIALKNPIFTMKELHKAVAL